MVHHLQPEAAVLETLFPFFVQTSRQRLFPKVLTTFFTQRSLVLCFWVVDFFRLEAFLRPPVMRLPLHEVNFPRLALLGARLLYLQTFPRTRMTPSAIHHRAFLRRARRLFFALLVRFLPAHLQNFPRLPLGAALLYLQRLPFT